MSVPIRPQSPPRPCRANGVRRALGFILAALAALPLAAACMESGAHRAPAATAMPAPAEYAAARASAAIPGGAAIVDPVFSMENPRQNLRASFSPHGFRVTSREEGDARWSWGLRLDAYGRTGTHASPSPVPPVAAGNRVSYHRDGITEWYRNDPRGLEQGFTLKARPGDTDHPAPVEVVMTILGNLAGRPARHGGGIVFARRDGEAVLRYAKLLAFDAQGRPLPAAMEMVPPADPPGGAAARIRILVDDQGAVYPITIDPLVFSDTKLIPADLAPLDNLGYSVSLGTDTALIGAPLHNGIGNNSGAAYVFRRDGDAFVEEAELIPGDLAPLDQLGYAVAIDGDTAVVGAPLHNEAGNDSGIAYVFRLMGGSWLQEGRLVPSDLAPFDEFGYAVALSGDTAVVGAPFHNEIGSDAGAVYVFRRMGGLWMEEAKLVPTDLAPLDNFGYAVAVDGDTAVVGAPHHNHAGNDSGAAYAFLRIGALWMQQSKLVPSDLAPLDNFGYAVGLSGEATVVGAPNHNTVGNNAGIAYVFRRTVDEWSQEARLVPDDLNPLDNFGYSVSIFQDFLAVGSPLRNDLGDNSGAAYFFRRAMGIWSQSDKLTAADLSPLDTLGRSVSVGCDAIGVGAPQRNDVGDNSGGAYIFSDLFSVPPCVIRVRIIASAPPPASIGGRPGGKSGGKRAAAIRLRAALLPTGIMPDAMGDLAYRSAGGRQRVRLNLRKVAPGDYSLRVSGVDVGAIHVGRGKGKLEFDSEPARGRLPLNFDPRGRKVEVVHADGVILEAGFPQ